MTRYLIALLLILPLSVLAQKRKHYPEPRVSRYYEGYNDCAYQNRFEAVQRRSFFPFSKAESIRLISYENGDNMPIRIVEPGTEETIIPIAAEDTMPVFTPLNTDNFFVNYCKIKELRDLSKNAVDSLTNILYNVTRKPVKFPDDYADPGAKCYMPLNAILFMDNEGRVTQYIEICFHCQKYFYSSSKTREINYCDQKWDMLKSFFIAQGVKYGAVPDTEE